MKHNDLTAPEIRNLFDQILRQRIEGFGGTSVGLGTLPLSCVTISCLILLTERENEIENFGLDPSERYTQETFLEELAEMGLQSDADLKKSFQEITQKGYSRIDADGRFFPEKLTISMANILDRIFPAMPGMNLVAYLIQTMDEVQSGRKDLEFAISQFDQTLQMKGVSLKKEKAGPCPHEALKPTVNRVTTLEKIRLLRISHSESKILSSGDHSARKEIKTVHFREFLSQQDESPESSPKICKENGAQSLGMESDEKREAPDEQNETEGVCAEPEIPSEPGAETADFAGEEDLLLSQDEEKEYGTKSIPEEHVPDNADDIIEKRIATFEEDLAMQCPLCNSGKVKATETAMGKVYYKCSNKNCIFVSWGKPYHLVCPQCNNPFLVETVDRDGKKIIRCPRATCRYQQKSPFQITGEQREKAGSPSEEPTKKPVISRKPRKRVVRRRLVRRKR